MVCFEMLQELRANVHVVKNGVRRDVGVMEKLQGQRRRRLEHGNLFKRQVLDTFKIPDLPEKELHRAKAFDNVI